ncbi:Flp pilus assembly protein, ATPase CpaE [Mycobacteroides abscessus subsp. abscessus]|uniref:ParA family protein n=1 Tax=Mycobacteroides abscessus TaxID=36809 RepID=UPI00092BCE23|nr:ParA family protein [Mycobacteroides abscessus]SIC06250.1 Flp pilus assembly protein, ATPase CpaE [Mycobacteroides abscessus subsp. abscessus]
MTTNVLEAPFWVRLKSEVTEEVWARIEAIVPSLIVTVAAWKGGVGKTELAKELAYLFAAVLVDLDWDAGGITRKWGYRHEARSTAPLLDAIESGRVPKPLSGHDARADLVPSHPDFVANQPPADQMASHLEKWQAAWRRPLVTDTHPGGTSSTLGAVSAAHVIVVPVNLEVNVLRATEQMADELQGGVPLFIVPNRVSSAPETQVKWLERICDTFEIPCGPVVYNHQFLKDRHLTMAVCSPGKKGNIPNRAKPFVEEMYEVAKAVVLFAANQSKEA